MAKKRVSILGSTGSIGTQALEIVACFPRKFKVVALSARENLELLEEQSKKVHPSLVSVQTEAAARELKKKIPRTIKVVSGEAGLIEAAGRKDADLVLMAIAGSAGLNPLLAAIDAGKNIALANKEPMVMAGEIITGRALKKGVKVIPVDSEHSAIFQLIRGKHPEEIRRVILSASGGPFRGKSREQMNDATVEDALRHPTWKMGRKISVDSATLMNKALELIEAKWLFGLRPEQLEVIIHPQSVIHSMVETRDGAICAYLSAPDMRIPIAYALFFPERPELDFPRLDLEELAELKFEPADQNCFPGLKLGFQALHAGGTLPAVMNAADEEAVSAFLSGKIGFNNIVELVEIIMNEHKTKSAKTLKEILEADHWARTRAGELINV